MLIQQLIVINTDIFIPSRSTHIALKIPIRWQFFYMCCWTLLWITPEAFVDHRLGTPVLERSLFRMNTHIPNCILPTMYNSISSVQNPKLYLYMCYLFILSNISHIHFPICYCYTKASQTKITVLHILVWTSLASGHRLKIMTY